MAICPTIMSVLPRLFLLAVFALSCAGCMTRKQAVSLRSGGDVTPVVEVKPGYVERIALMDQYRLHDETRKHMMHRPHVTVEELTTDEVEALPPAAEEEEEAPQAQGVTSASQ
jgi:hypothetical protein